MPLLSYRCHHFQLPTSNANMLYVPAHNVLTTISTELAIGKSAALHKSAICFSVEC